MAYFEQKPIKITELKVLGQLPDPFLREDGSRVTTAEQFEQHKKSLFKSAVELQYGTIPPSPEFLKVELLGSGRKSTTYRVVTGRREYPVSFCMKVYKPADKDGRCPVIVNGDGGFDYILDPAYLDTALSEGIAVVMFDRTELVPDVAGEERDAPLYNCYPEHTFGALGAWAWGYMRCVDAIEQLDVFDMNNIAFTGHSRGGKTAMLAGVLDTRAAVVNPNETCAGSCSCYRIHLTAVTEEGKQKRSETLSDLCRRFGFWMGPDMAEYATREQDLPFDEHFLKALVAPRTLVIGEAASDIWSNPVGSWMTSRAAEEVYKLYGVERGIYWYFRRGEHCHKPEDLAMLVSVIKHRTEGRPLCDGFFSTPFEQPELIYDWRCPTR